MLICQTRDIYKPGHCWWDCWRQYPPRNHAGWTGTRCVAAPSLSHPKKVVIIKKNQETLKPTILSERYLVVSWEFLVDHRNPFSYVEINWK